MPMARIALMATCLEMMMAFATETKFGAINAKNRVTTIRAMNVRNLSSSSSADALLLARGAGELVAVDMI